MAPVRKFYFVATIACLGIFVFIFRDALGRRIFEKAFNQSTQPFFSQSIRIQIQYRFSRGQVLRLMVESGEKADRIKLTFGLPDLLKAGRKVGQKVQTSAHEYSRNGLRQIKLWSIRLALQEKEGYFYAQKAETINRSRCLSHCDARQ